MSSRRLADCSFTGSFGLGEAITKEACASASLCALCMLQSPNQEEEELETLYNIIVVCA